MERGFIAHCPDGAYVFRPEKIVDFEGALRAQFARDRRLVKSAFALDGVHVDLASGPAGCLCAVKLKSLSIATQFAQAGDFLTPVFNTSGIMLTLEWPVPGDMELRFAADCTPYRSLWVMGECFLFARKVGRGGFFKLPLPNTLDDGRICMGDEVRGTVKGDTLAGCFKDALDCFRKTRWNTDLAPNTVNTRALFRWDSGRQPVPPPSDWESHCRAISRTEMEDLCPA